MKSYKDLEIYNLSFEYAIKVHKMTLKLPKYELYETGSQLRRSSKSVVNNIAEGYGRRKYKGDFVRFLIYSQASLLESTTQLEMIKEIHMLDGVDEVINNSKKLGAKIYSFINYVENNWKT
ncbi:MAG: four helix bundle protein [Flavobacteriaceae bacterium]|nr:MAG: four helix bundle protein [Flavobacteriaceae bacterium]